MDKINYYLIGESIISKLKPDIKPKLLLHACCGPCATYPVTYLLNYFDITIYFNNSNIFPIEEYERRRDELIRFIEEFNKDNNCNIKIIITSYDNKKYMEDLWPLKDEPECGKRCQICYKKRMEEAYEFADKNGYVFFTTVMSISRQKSSTVMNEIGKELEAKFTHTKYFYSDFKKHDGQLKSNEIKHKYNLYQQTYCGCEISFNNRKIFEENKLNNK